jgi:hypothetical protein
VSPDAPLLDELSQIITKETAALSQFLKARGDAPPSHRPEGVTDWTHLSPEATASRNALLAATSSLRDLILGPAEKLRWLAWDFNDQLSLTFINQYNIASLFPLDSTITLVQISKAIDVDLTNVSRMIRHAIMNRIFVEISPGVIAHTAASRILAEDKNMKDWIGLTTEDIWPASAATLTAMKLYPGSQEMTQTGFQVANNTVNVEPLFATLGKNPLKAKRFGGAMTSLISGEGYEVSHLVSGAASKIWKEVDDKEGTVVDLGGSHGAVDIILAETYTKTKYIVQELPKMLANAPEVKNPRISFMVQDFYAEQAVVGADGEFSFSTGLTNRERRDNADNRHAVYFFRWIFHNQSTKYALRILRALIPALKPGARVIINDNVLPQLGQDSMHNEKITRTMDLVMLTLLNAQERTKEDYETLFEEADKRFKLVSITREEGGIMSVVEAVWEPEATPAVEGETKDVAAAEA